MNPQMRDARELENGAIVETDVCIIGSGPAGVAVASQLANIEHLRVLVVESGNLSPEEPGRQLNKGEITGLSYGPLEITRERAIGGSANLWDIDIGKRSLAALLRPLDVLDFETHEWQSHSGWPISLSDLNPYYRLAYEMCGLGAKSADDFALLDLATNKQLSLDSDQLETTVFTHGESRLFTAASEIEFMGKAEYLYNATVSQLITDSQGAKVVSCQCSVDEQHELTINANRFVLAGGGIENPRLLLESKGIDGVGLGNEHDLVGRFFMEHPKGELSLFVPHSNLVETLNNYACHSKDDISFRYLLTLADKLRMKEKLFGCGMSLWPTEPDWLSDDLRDIAIRVRATHGSEAPLFAISFMTEQTPNPDSRVELSDIQGPGGRLPSLNWRLDAADLHSLNRVQQIVQEELQSAGLGTVYNATPFVDDAGNYRERSWRGDPYPMAGSHHHMGTTRMHSDPRSGVVDANCRVHGTENLYVSGSSTFPTGGYVNPTLTIIAMGIRLGKHLADTSA